MSRVGPGQEDQVYEEGIVIRRVDEPVDTPARDRTSLDFSKASSFSGDSAAFGRKIPILHPRAMLILSHEPFLIRRNYLIDGSSRILTAVELSGQGDRRRCL